MAQIKAILILEIMGKPAEHIQSVLKQIIENLGKEKDVKIISSNMAEPKNLQLRNTELNIFFNELMRKMHQYDEIAKAMLIERENLNNMIKDGKIKVEGVIDIENKEKQGKKSKKARKKSKK